MDHDHPRTAQEAALDAAKLQSSHEPPAGEISDFQGPIDSLSPLLGRVDDDDDGAGSTEEAGDSDASELDSQDVSTDGNGDDDNLWGESAPISADSFDPTGADGALDDITIAEAGPNADTERDGAYSPGAVGWSTLSGVNVGFAAAGSGGGGLMPGGFVPSGVDLPVESEPYLEPVPIDLESIAAGAAGKPVLRPDSRPARIEQLPYYPQRDQGSMIVQLPNIVPDAEDPTGLVWNGGSFRERSRNFTAGTADGGPPLARPTVLVTLTDGQTRQVLQDALADDARRCELRAKEVAEFVVHDVFWHRDCQMRAVLGK